MGHIHFGCGYGWKRSRVASFQRRDRFAGFVYTRIENPEGAEIRQGWKCVKCQFDATVRMETPVLYFYADKETDVSVRVGFPRGKITEWYPQASAAYPYLDWGQIRVMPGAAVDFPVDKSANHYYAARKATDATLPLTLDPKPSELVRVMVGRVEVITPELESSVEKIVAAIKNSESYLPVAAKELAQKHGRFVVSALKRILARPGDPQGKNIILRLIPFTNV